MTLSTSKCSVILRRNACARASASQRRHVGENPTLYTPASWRNRHDRRHSTQPDRLDAKMEHAIFRAGRASDAEPGCITRWLPAALAREARRIRAIADDGSTTPCGVMFEESDSVVEKLIEGIRTHPPPTLEYSGPIPGPVRPLNNVMLKYSLKLSVTIL
ncbi:hypothetical protein HPB47_012147 [Ixodes persulcatus]|uniref:Uncharacterized protein n=1 Tax=Ixodes persulcatus TaxID=34615 RepID=A0AC60NU96_IXOPE|nr:hypothetical protein HPB47_012147 [Ixodes persulcatus]